MDLSVIRKIEELGEQDDVNAYIKTGRWVLIETAGGRDSDGFPIFRYSLGWLGPDPEHPETDSSEHPELPTYGRTDLETW